QLERPRRLQPARSAALQILLHVCLASKQLPCRKRERYLHFHVGADSGETLARHADDCEWNSLDLQSFADSVPRAPVMALPEAVAEHGHLRGCVGTQIFILRSEQVVQDGEQEGSAAPTRPVAKRLLCSRRYQVRA